MIFPYAFYIAVLALALWAAFEDVRQLRIRNTICGAIALLFVPFAFLIPLHDVLVHAILAAVVFGIAIGLYFGRLFGAGDVKLLAVLTLWVGSASLGLFLLSTTIAGGFLALIALGIKRSGALAHWKANKPALFGPEKGWLASLERGETVVPYGVAMAIGFAVTLF